MSRWPRAMRYLAPVAAAFASGCGSLLFGIANVPAGFGDHTRSADIAYGGLPRQRLDVYRPGGASGSRPVVVFWYGGGWTKGSREQYRFVGAALAEAGYVAVLPDYRLYPQVRFPAFIEDGALALAWAQAHAREHGGDPSRLYVMGHSAGAHLAALLAVDPRYLRDAGGDPGAISGVIGLSGPYALAPDDGTLRSIFAAPATPRDWQPVQRVSTASPPTLLVHGADDDVVWPSHSEEFAAALRAVGVPVQLELYAGRGHADTVAALSIPGRGRAPVLDAVRGFIDGRSDPSR